MKVGFYDGRYKVNVVINGVRMGRSFDNEEKANNVLGVLSRGNFTWDFIKHTFKVGYKRAVLHGKTHTTPKITKEIDEATARFHYEEPRVFSKGPNEVITLGVSEVIRDPEILCRVKFTLSGGGELNLSITKDILNQNIGAVVWKHFQMQNTPLRYDKVSVEGL